MELNREQIIKALECWASGNACEGIRCEMFEISPDTCDRWIGRNALALINELTEENERLRERADRHLKNLKAVLDERSESNIKADTVREFAERLTASWKSICYESEEYLGIPEWIAQIAQEMLEGNDGTGT